MQKWAWAAFWLTSAIWGSSFLLIRVGVEEVSPGQLAFLRCLIAAVGLNVVMFLRGRRYPKDRQTWIALALVGFGNATLPYFLIGWGEQNIESALASIVQSTVPLFALVIAHFYLVDERMTWPKVIGLLLGFIGVVVLAMRSMGGGGENSLWGMLAIVGASLSYAAFTVYSRTSLLNKNIQPIVVSAGSFIFAALFGLAFIVLEPLLGIGQAWLPSLSKDVVIAIILLGLINTFVAYLFWYFVVNSLGAFVASNVTYIVPVFGVTLGWLVLNEKVDALLLVGAALIFAGLAVINLGGPLMRRLRGRGLPVAVGD